MTAKPTAGSIQLGSWRHSRQPDPVRGAADLGTGRRICYGPAASDHWEELMPAVLRVVLSAGVILMGVGVLGGEALAADPVTKDDAVALVKKAVADIKDQGTQKAYAEIDNKSGKFVVGDFYIAVVGFDGTLLAYGADMHRVGDNVMNLKDPDGKEVVKERIELAQKQDSFWQSYKFMNPVSKTVEPKQMYCERLDKTVVCGGVYEY
jgi:cytochrome c